MTASYVYFAYNTHAGLIKVGRSKDVQKRLGQIQSGQTYRLKLLGIIPGGPDEERSCHWLLRHWRDRSGTSREWFTADKNALSIISKILQSGGPPNGIKRRAKILTDLKSARWKRRHQEKSIKRHEEYENRRPEWDPVFQKATTEMGNFLCSLARDRLLVSELAHLGTHKLTTHIDMIKSITKLLNDGGRTTGPQMTAIWRFAGNIWSVINGRHHRTTHIVGGDSICIICRKKHKGDEQHHKLTKLGIREALFNVYGDQWRLRRFGPTPSARAVKVAGKIWESKIYLEVV